MASVFYFEAQQGQRDDVLAQTLAKLTLHFTLCSTSDFVFVWGSSAILFHVVVYAAPPHTASWLILNDRGTPTLLLSRSKATYCHGKQTQRCVFIMVIIRCLLFLVLKIHQKYLRKLCSVSEWLLNEQMSKSLQRVTDLIKFNGVMKFLFLNLYTWEFSSQIHT